MFQDQEDNQAGWEQQQYLDEMLWLEQEANRQPFSKSHEDLLRQAQPGCDKFDEDFNKIFGK